MNMRIILYILLSIFVAGNVLTEWRNRKTIPWMTNPMSAYLAYVPWAWMQDLGFLALIIALFLLSVGLSLSQIPFIIGACALFLVVLTKYLQPTDAKQQALIQWFHNKSAAVAFTAVIAGILWRTWHTGGLANGAALASICVAFLFLRFAPKRTELEEKAVAACIIVALYAFSSHL